MFYKDIIEHLFNEFYDNSAWSKVTYDNPIDGRLVSSGLLKGREELTIILRVGLRDKGEEHFRSLEVTTPEKFKDNPRLECASGSCGVIFFVQSNAVFGEWPGFAKEKIWLNYSGLSGRHYNPATPGAERIEAIHVKLREWLAIAKPLVIDMEKRPEAVHA